MPKVSIIIPTYNRAYLLPRTIKSVLNQTFKDFELIIVDDGSLDNTREVVEEFQKKDQRVKYIWQENSGRPARPKNVGIKNAKGEYIAFLDSDDEWLPEKLEKQLSLFEYSKKKSLGLVSCNAFIISQGGKILGEYHTSKVKFFLPEFLEQSRVLSNSGIILPKDIIKRVGFFDEKTGFAEDQDMWIRIAKAGYSFDFVAEPLFKYYIHPENFFKNLTGKDIIKIYEYILLKHLDIYKKYPKAYSIRLRNIGSMYVLNNDMQIARRYFIKAIQTAPLHLRNYMNLIISVFGSKFYKRILYQKRKIVGDLLVNKNSKKV